MLALETGKNTGKKKRETEVVGAERAVEIELSNIERARLVPEI